MKVDNSNIDKDLDRIRSSSNLSNNDDSFELNKNNNLNQTIDNKLDQTDKTDDNTEMDLDEFNNWFADSFLQNVYKPFAHLDLLGIDANEIFCPWNLDTDVDVNPLFSP
ncbi:unnamed protein product [Rotaria sordida]|uniref:Uncharacterized protein n=1 Tax=Rotaria sordida TaxID=392033 RepID=A0A814FBY4_9BILA|nr:unnamed protein product [Rotaria sordida]CAF1378220.1 unnamed protein product [Rotaria sordida]CAF3970818.1 unnamed protein product [Rotaria sordida]CAF4135802.1 unnamed protein product [Rotaria sordida]